MPPLTPSSSQEIIPISPPPEWKVRKRVRVIPGVVQFPETSSNGHSQVEEVSASLLGKGLKRHYSSRTPKEETQLVEKPRRIISKKPTTSSNADRQLSPYSVPQASSSSLLGQGQRNNKLPRKENANHLSQMSHERLSEHALSTLKSSSNPITHSDQFTRTDHVHSASTGHQQRGADRGYWASARDMGLQPDLGGGQEATYWSVRTKSVENILGREKKSNILSGCVIAINGPTRPRISNIQLQNLVTTHGGRFSPREHSGCTHIVATRLSGTKSQKYIHGQGSRGASRRARVVKVDWVLDCVEHGKRLSEAGYTVIEDPTQSNLFSSFGTQPKSAS